MKAVVLGSLLIGAALAANPAAAENAPEYSHCVFPATAPTVPDGNTATADQMNEAAAATKTYVDEAQKGLSCLEGERDKLGGEPMTEEQMADYKVRYDAAYNALTAAAEAYNTAVRAYKAKNPG